MNLFDKKQNEFAGRHIGPAAQETAQMLEKAGFASLDELIDKTIPPAIHSREGLALSEALSENEYLKALRKSASKNKVFRSFIGQ
ncbi:MAG: hypothetical protein H3C36_08620, partial [Chitinophagaceae bacterium]|nr:hypothetical protein [Chitinophagaceae bacterium]